MPQTCHACGNETIDGDNSNELKTSYSKRKKLCLNCEARRARTVSDQTLLLYLAIGSVGAALHFGGSGWQGLGTIMLNWFLIYFFMILATVPHELGHAFAARWMGFAVERIDLGLGTPLFRGQLFGFRINFRRIPFGGFTFVLPDNRPWFRTRWLTMIVAGPLVNAVLAGAVYLVLKPSIPLSLSKELNPVGFFVIANLFVFIENLIPFQWNSNGNIYASDGRLFLDLLLPGKASAANKESRLRAILRNLSRIVLILFLACCALFSLAVGAILVGMKIWEKSWASFLLLELLFVAMAAVLIWAIWRVAKNPRWTTIGRPSDGVTSIQLPPNQALSPYASLYREYYADFGKFAEWPEGTSPPLLFSELTTLIQKQSFHKLETAVQPYLGKPPRNLWFEVVYATALSGQRRYIEAGAVYENLLRWTELSTGSKAVLKSEVLRCLVLADQFKEAAAQCEEFLASTDSVPAKAQVLDVLASLPHVADRPDYLPEADKWSRRVLEIAPGFITLKGTRGAVLADQGRFAEAKPTLQEVYGTSESDIDKGISLFYLALCAKAEGDLAHATKLARRAATIHPEPWLLERVKRERLG